jgi:serine/threonine-protein kinase ATR
LNGSPDPTVHNRTFYTLGSLCDSCSRLIVNNGNSLPDTELQKELASVVEKLIDRYDAEYGYIIEEFLLPSFRAIAHDTSKFEAASEPLRRVVRQYLQGHDTNGHTDVVMSDHIAQIHLGVPTSRPAKTKPLRRGLQGLCNPQDSLSSGQSEDVYEKLKHSIAALLGKGTTTDTDSLDVA